MNALALRAGLALALAPIFVVPALAQEPPAQSEAAADSGRSPALTHIHHVAETFRGTPENRGLLATAVAEAEIALQHATLAAQDPSDVASVHRHVGHVLHALDPSAMERGPGLGYGAVQAAERTAHYIELAAISDGATEAIETHSHHIATASTNAVSNGEAAVELAKEILAATKPAAEAQPADSAEAAEEPEAGEEGAGAEEAAEEGAEEEAPDEAPEEEPLDVPAAVSELVSLTRAVLEGVDANGDGRVGWQEGEGGLAQAEQHLQLLLRAEGLGG